MARHSLAPLSPEEEIVLRRIAHGSIEIDRRIADRLVAQALVERAPQALRLTPLGLLRFRALPKAPLLARRRSLQAAAGYVSAVIERAQGQVRSEQRARDADADDGKVTDPPSKRPS